MAGSKLPVTLSAVDRQAQLIREGKLSPAEPVARPTISPEEVRARLAENKDLTRIHAVARNLAPGIFPNGAAGLKPDDEFDGSQMTLHPRQIKKYDRNPRRKPNHKYSEIKESIKAVGVLNPITVTRRPGSTEYMVFGGGNTRLDICQELAIEFPDNSLYAAMQVTYRAWRGEAAVIAAHAAENELRGDTTFWDKANTLVALKKELELENGAALTSNDVRLKAAPIGWKVSRDTVLLYDFAIEWLAPVGPWLTHSVTKVLKDRFGTLSNTLSRLDVNGGAITSRSVLAEELDLQAGRLAIESESQGLGSRIPEIDATAICNALDERVAKAIGSSVPELRQMLAIIATNAQISATQLRAEAAKGVVVARAPAPANQATPSAPATAPVDVAPTPTPTQAILPTPMLAAVRPVQASDSAPAPANAPGNAGLPALQDQGDLPAELAVGAAPAATPDAAVSIEAKRAAALALLDAMRVLADHTLNTEFFRVHPMMPLGFFMEPPVGPLQPQPHLAMPADQQIRLRRAGWQLLATLSTQFDHRACNERFLPADSRWLQLVRTGDLRQTLADCGIGVSADGDLQLDADCLFYVLTEPKLLSPAVAELLRALAVRRGTLAKVLPHRLEPVTRTPAMAA